MLEILDPGPFLEDAAHYPGGHAAGVVFPRRTRDVAAQLAASTGPVLSIGAQSSLTGGATPRGELLFSTSKMTRVLASSPGYVTVEAGLSITALQEHLSAANAWFPPAPTYTGASAGGVVSTNAAGAATFKYGSTRDWVEALVVVLADGTVLDLARGEHRARDGRLRIPTAGGPLVVRVPSYAMPAVSKRSAGYHAAPDMDLIDLFIGAEGTLGVVTEVTFRVQPRNTAVALALIPCATDADALRLTLALRDASLETWRSASLSGIDVCAIENIDARSIAILREDGADRRNDTVFPDGTAAALLVQLELPAELTRAAAFRQIEDALQPGADDSPLARFCQVLEAAGLLEVAELALPGDDRRMSQFIALREAVPAGVNRRVGLAKRDIDPRIEKTAADMVVPMESFGEMMDVYRRGFNSRGLDYAIWGHISDGNVHPNVIPASYDDVLRGKAAILEFGRAAAALGGCPLAEHGVGRNPTKQALLRSLYGESGIEEMRAVKRALDPHWRLAPRVIFPRG
ncbi:MAG: FAD-binding oxidoreductase [Acidobacteriota bacterium]